MRKPLLELLLMLALLLGPVSLAFGLTRRELRPIAEAVTVQVDQPWHDGVNTGGSGILVDREALGGGRYRYTVLSNCHVLKRGQTLTAGSYILWVGSGRERASYTDTVQSPGSRCHPDGVDLALFRFESRNEYRLAQLQAVDAQDLNDTYISAVGFPNPDRQLGGRFFRFSEQGLVLNAGLPGRDGDGYEIQHKSETRVGMSGGPLLDNEGRVVAVNGQAINADGVNTVDYYGIPIRYYLDWQGLPTSSPVVTRPSPRVSTPVPSLPPPPTPLTPPSPRPTPSQPTHLGIPVEPYSYTSARVSRTGEVSTYRTESPIGRYVEERLPLPRGAVELAMVAIPGGSFRMGSPESEEGRWTDERPQHEVTLPDFFIGQYEVTQAQWFAVMGRDYDAKGWQEIWNADTGSWILESVDSDSFKGDNHPIVQVSWEDAAEFCRRLSQLTGRNYRLATEAEWEYAARAGTTTPFAYGETIVPSVVNYDGNWPYGDAPKGEYRKQTVPVNELYPNPWGLFHVHGNVREWVQDGNHESYSNKPEELKRDGSRPWLIDTDVLEDDLMVLRGGSWYYDARYTRSADRDRNRRDNRVLNGFRVVLQ